MYQSMYKQSFKSLHKRMIRKLFYKSPDLCLEEQVFIFYERLHHLSLVADVIECCHGVQVWSTHQGGSKNNGEVLCVHQVEFIILCHPEM